MPTQLARLLNRLVATRPDSRAAAKVRMEAEHAVLRLVKAGQRAADRAIKAVRLGSVRLAREFKVSHTSQWRATLGDKTPMELIVWYSASRYLQATYVQFSAVPAKPALTPRQRARHEAQEEFYKRYTDVGQRWYRGLGQRRLPKADNVILLIGELEADVNNGGFSQYLDNKGRRRALAAMAALRTIGASKTAAMLMAAMSPSATERSLGALDARFYRVPEDLAVVTMRWVGRGKR